MVPTKTVVVIIVLTGVALIVRVAFAGSWWVQELAPNVATELLGILVTVLIIDRTLERRRQAKSKTLEGIAARKLGRSLKRIADLFAEMVHASFQPTPLRPQEPPTSLLGVLSPDNARYLIRLDLSVDGNFIPLRPWVDHAAEILAAERTRLRELTDTYLAHLPIDTVDAIERIEEDSVITFLIRFRELYPESRKWEDKSYMLGDDWRGYVEDLFSVLRVAIQAVTGLAGEEDPTLPPDFWTGVSRPQSGRDRAILGEALVLGVKPPRR